MLQDIDNQISLARTYLRPFTRIAALPDIAKQTALQKARHDLLLVVGSNQFCGHLENDLLKFAKRVKDAPAFIDAALMDCGVSMMRTCRELSDIRRDVDGVSSHAN